MRGAGIDDLPFGVELHGRIGERVAMFEAGETADASGAPHGSLAYVAPPNAMACGDGDVSISGPHEPSPEICISN